MSLGGQIGDSMNMNFAKTKPIALILCLLMMFAGCTSDAPVRVSDETYVVINDNIPEFTEDEITTEAFESYSPLDVLGRCGVAIACIGQEIMPTEERGSIGQVKPSGWVMAKYDVVDGKYLYNRCHLIGYQLTGENANEENLITGTRHMNTEGMLPFENMVADYVEETGNHVMYRVTPVFDGANLVASGVRMEALSVEDDGEGITFNVFVNNIQPGVEINYADGSSRLAGQDIKKEEKAEPKEHTAEEERVNFILNTSSCKYHKEDCASVDDIKPENRESYNGPRSWLEENGYSPCGRCKP